MLIAHSQTLAVARSCIAALADTAFTADAATAYEHALAALDLIHADLVPSINATLVRAESDRQLFVDALESVTRLRTYGLDVLHVDLVLAMLGTAHELDQC